MHIQYDEKVNSNNWICKTWLQTVNSNVRAEESSCCYSESPFSNSRYISDDVTGLSYGVSIVRCEDTSGKMKIELLTTKPNTSLENYNLKTCDQFGSDC